MSSADYEQHFASLSDGKLIALHDEPSDMVPEAVQAVREELVRRGLPEAEIQSYRAQRAEEAAARDRRTARISKVTGAVSTAVTEVGQTAVHTEPGPRSEKRYVLMLMAALVTYFILHIPRFRDFAGLIEYGTVLEAFIHFWPLVALLYAAFAVWRRWRSGWAISVVFTTYQAAGALLLLGWYLTEERGDSEFTIFQEPTILSVVLGALIHFAALVVFQLPRSSRIFHVTPAMRWSSISIGFALISVELWWY